MSTPPTIDQLARGVADRTAGASLEDLHRQQQAVVKKIDIWLASYRAALDDPRHEVPEPPYTVIEAAAALNVCASTAREMVHDGRLPRVPGTGRKFLIPRAAVANLLTTRPRR